MNRTSLIINELKKTKGYKNYNGRSNKITQFGYHSFDIDEIKIQGQRNTKQRINSISKYINFDGKIVVDVGCNVGGMLFHLKNIKQGFGFDFDLNVIDAANNISSILNKTNLIFKQFDFDKQDIEIFKKELPVIPDVVFFLSIANWIKNWKTVYDYFIDLNVDIVFETNEIKSELTQLEFFEERGLEPKLIIEGSPDDQNVKSKSIRNTYYVENKLLKKHKRACIVKNHNSVITKYYDKKVFNKIKNLYEHIKDIKYVPTIKFYEKNNSVKIPFLKNPLSRIKHISLTEKREIKNQIIDLINELQKVKINHKDLHTKNIFWDGSQIWVIDWEYICIAPDDKFENFYDINSKNGKAPIKNYRMDLFSENKYSIKNFLLPEVILKRDEFK